MTELDKMCECWYNPETGYQEYCKEHEPHHATSTDSGEARKDAGVLGYKLTKEQLANWLDEYGRPLRQQLAAKDTEIARLNSLNQDFCTKWQTAEHDNCQLTYALEQSETAFSKVKQRAETAEAELSAARADASNLKSHAHSICNENLTEALAAAIEATQLADAAQEDIRTLKALLNSK